MHAYCTVALIIIEIHASVCLLLLVRRHTVFDTPNFKVRQDAKYSQVHLIRHRLIRHQVVTTLSQGCYNIVTRL